LNKKQLIFFYLIEKYDNLFLIMSHLSIEFDYSFSSCFIDNVLSCHFLVIAVVVICRSSFLFFFFSSLSSSIGRFHMRTTSATSCSCSSSTYDGFSYFLFYFFFPLPFLRLLNNTRRHTQLNLFFRFFLFSTDFGEHNSKKKKDNRMRRRRKKKRKKS
jgi:hypothetical protein